MIGFASRGLRRFSTARLGEFEWVHNRKSWEYSYTVIVPDQVERSKGTLVMFPSTTLLSSREEWRECAEYLADIGYQSVLLDWPGWHQKNIPLNWALEDDVAQKSVISTYAQFAYSALDHIQREFPNSSLHAVAAGGNSGVHVKRALGELDGDNSHFSSLTCFSPSWRFYLTRYVSEGYPRKLARRQAIADWFLSSFFTRSKTMYRLYRSKLGLSKLTKRFYDEKLQHNSDLLEAKREVITRDRPLSIDAAMIAGHFDPVSSTQEFLTQLMGHDASAESAHPDDSDDDDSLLNIKVPNWVKPSPSPEQTTPEQCSSGIRLHLVFPQDVAGKDKRELQTIREWAEHAKISTSEIPGKLFCHEESPALSATLIHQFLSTVSPAS